MTAASHLRLARCLALDAVAVEVIGALAAAGIESILLKGPVTVHWLYADDPGSRSYADVDLLVAPDDFSAGLEVLSSLGFGDPLAGLSAREADGLYERPWIRGDREIVELHRSFAGVGDAQTFWTVLRQDSAHLTAAGVDVLAPGAAGAALLCALHAMHHGRDRRESVKPMADLRRALSRFDDATWRVAAELAAAARATGAFRVGLQLDPAGVRLTERIRGGTAASPGVWLRATGPEHRGDTQFGRFLGATNSRARVREFVNAVFPSPSLLSAPRPWARRGTVWLALAYVQRWWRIIVRTPRAAVHWLRACRLAREAGWVPVRRVTRRRKLARAAARRAVRPDLDRAVATWWALRALRSVKGQLHHDAAPTHLRVLPVPVRFAGRPEVITARSSTVDAVLELAGASCLESAVVRQRWCAAAGHLPDVVVGVALPESGLRAHAWLDGDRVAGGFTELTRYPSPPAR
ncbi:MAG: nucleotidyltransferase family protein [Jatrophihabitantaceae bacterium]